MTLVSGLCLVLATGAPAQADETATAAMADSLAAAAELPEPNPAALDLSAVDLWDTGLSATGAVVMTPLFPGWGQLYARNSWHAALGFGATMYFWSNMWARNHRATLAADFSRTFALDNPNRDYYRDVADENWAQMRDFAWWSGGVLLITALDAYVGAYLFDFDQDPVPVPDRWEDAFGLAASSAAARYDGPTVVVFQWRKRF